MSHYFSRLVQDGAVGAASLQTVFDAERGTPELLDQLAQDVPQIREVMADLRQALPLVPHSGVGPIGNSGFYRLPNHYRSVSFMLPPPAGGARGASPGVIVFKGTEPLIQDFPAYFNWMMNAPFRSSALPLALHFPMDMKLPPAAMWIEECIAEQAVSSRVQQQYLARHGRLARLPLPLFVFKMTPAQVGRYEDVIRARVPADGLKKIRNKLVDGLGVEIYYYPELPVRVADLFVGNVRETFKAALTPEQVEATAGSWAKLFAEMLCLQYMPYAPWHHGMGACLDQGNVCIDGGFNDLLTLIPFDSIPDELLFRQSLQTSIRMLGESMAALAAASLGVPSNAEFPDAGFVGAGYVTAQLRAHVQATGRDGLAIDARLRRCLDIPGVADIVDLVRKSQRVRGKASQFIGDVVGMDVPPARALLEAVAGV